MSFFAPVNALFLYHYAKIVNVSDCKFNVNFLFQQFFANIIKKITTFETLKLS